MIRWVLVRDKVCMWCTQEHLLSQLVQAVLHEWFQLAQVQPVHAAVLHLQTNDSPIANGTPTRASNLARPVVRHAVIRHCERGTSPCGRADLHLLSVTIRGNGNRDGENVAFGFRADAAQAFGVRGKYDPKPKDTTDMITCSTTTKNNKKGAPVARIW